MANPAPLCEGPCCAVQRHVAVAAGRSTNLDRCPVVPASVGAQRLDDSFLRGKTGGESRRRHVADGRQAICRLILGKGPPNVSIAESSQRFGDFADTHEVDANLKRFHSSGREQPPCHDMPMYALPSARLLLPLGPMTGEQGAANVLAGTATRYALLLTNIAAGVVLMPYTVHHLGQQRYGLWMMVASVTYYFSLLDLGYGNGVVKQLVDADARGDVRRMNVIASTFVGVYAALAVAAGLIAAALIVFVIPRLPGIAAGDVPLAQGVVAILAARAAIGLPMTVFGAVTNARQGFVVNGTIAIVFVIANAVVTWAVLASGGGLLALVGLTTIASMAGYAAYAWSAHHAFPELRIRLRQFDRAEWRSVTGYSLYLFLISFAVQLSFNVDNLVVGGVLGTAAVAVYSVATRLSEYQRRLSDQFSGMLFPVVVGYRSGGDDRAVRTALVEGTRLSLLLVTAATIVLVGFAKPLIHWWMGPGFEGSFGPLVVLAAIGVIIVGHGAQHTVLLACGRQRLVAIIWISEGIANIAFSLVFVHYWGATGVALGTLVPVIIGHVGVMTPTACRAVALTLRQFARQCVLPSVTGAVPAVVTCLLLRTWFPPQSLAGIVAEAVPTFAVFGLTVFGVGFDRETRAGYVRHLRKARVALRPARASA
jgi:O-antigen/teichoic acid export membrane protein